MSGVAAAKKRPQVAGKLEVGQVWVKNGELRMITAVSGGKRKSVFYCFGNGPAGDGVYGRVASCRYASFAKWAYLARNATGEQA